MIFLNHRRHLQSTVAPLLPFKAATLCLLLLIAPLNAQAGNGFASMMSSMFGAMGSMANMMSTMMSPMSMMGVGSGFSMIPGMNSGYPMMSSIGIPGGFQGMNSMPFGAYPGMPMTNGFPALPGSGLGPQSTDNPSTHINESSNGPGNYWLNGLWVSQEQAILHINNKTFQLQSKKGSIMGYATSNGELLNLYIPQSGQTMLFIVKLIGNTLQLKGRNGRTIVFQRRG